MPDKINDGGPAFPGEQGMTDGLWNPTWGPGMSRLEYHASNAMMGLLAAGGAALDSTLELYTARNAVKLAVALMEALEEKK